MSSRISLRIISILLVFVMLSLTSCDLSDMLDVDVEDAEETKAVPEEPHPLETEAAEKKKPGKEDKEDPKDTAETTEEPEDTNDKVELPPEEETAPYITIVKGKTTYNSVGFEINEFDPEEKGTVTKIELLKDSTVVKHTDKPNTREFKDLLSGTNYVVRVTYKYTLKTKSEVSVVSLDISTKSYVAPTIEISITKTTETSVTYNYTLNDPDKIATINRVYLLDKNENKLSVGTAAKTFSGLDLATRYYISVEYEYNLSDGNGVITKTEKCAFTTGANTEPTLTLTLTQIGKDSVKYDYTLVDPDNAATISGVYLLDSNGNELSVGSNTKTFSGLYSSCTYSISVEYIYNSGSNSEVRTVKRNFTTLAMTQPTFNLEITDVGKNSITYNYVITDTDSLVSSTEVYLLDTNGNKLENTPINNVFSGLESGKTYTVVAKSEYDLNTYPQETLTNTSTENVLTLFDIEIDSERAYDDTIFEGQSVSISFTITNIENVTFTHIKVGGQSVAISKSGSTYYASVTPNITSGKFDVIFESITYTLDGKAHTANINHDTGIDIIVLGDVTIAGISFSNGKTYAENGESVVGYIDFIGSEGYTMISCGGIGSLTKVTDTRYSFSTSYMNGIYKITSITYSLDGSSETINCTGTSFSFYNYDHTEMIEISTPEELQNMSSTGRYKLVCDIDLEGFDWRPYSFNGYLYGNGYEIKNLYVNSYRNDDEYQIGMFSTLGGSLVGLKLTNARVEVTVSGAWSTYAGILVGRGAWNKTGHIIDCHVEGDITITSTGRSDDETIAGICGYGDGLSVVNCYYKGNIVLIYTDQNIDTEFLGHSISGVLGFRGKGFGCSHDASGVIIAGGKNIVINDPPVYGSQVNL